jgi:peptidoglycan-associated lipoprotein
LTVLAIAAMFVAACASKPTQDDEAAARAAAERAAAEAAAAETRRVTEPEVVELDPLEDPSSILAQRIIYFDFDRSDVKPEFMAVIQAHAQYMVAHPDARVTLEGHTDERGAREYNIALGNRRAQAVRRMLMFHGVADRQVTTVSYGEEKPVALGQNEEAWSRNRRVEIAYEQR